MPSYQYFPKNSRLPAFLGPVIACFTDSEAAISSAQHTLSSDDVLNVLTPSLQAIGYRVETGKDRDGSIHVPVLFGEDGRPEKSFSCDAISADGRVVLEVEAGRGVTNYQFLKDLFQACMMADVEYLVLGVRLLYRNSHDYQRARTFLETLYASDRLNLPLKGILLIGY